MTYPRSLSVVALLVFCSVGRGEKWKLTTGQEISGSLSGVYGPVAVVSTPKGSSVCALSQFGEGELDRVSDYLAAHKTEAPKWKTSDSPVAKALRNRLQILHDGKLTSFDPGDRAEPEFYLIYFSAHWCAPCRRFTPKLVETYHQLRAAPESEKAFEVIFVSRDHDGTAQEKYVNEVAMPWPYVKFSQLGRLDVIEKWAGAGIPCLVVLNRGGDVIYHTYNGDEYLGPDEPLQRFAGLLAQLDPQNRETKLARYPLALRQHLKAFASTDSPPKPYLLSLTLQRYPKGGVKPFNATLQIDAAGQVSSVEGTGELPDALVWQFKNDAQNWKFLPAVKNGVAIPSRVAIPVHF